jgi:hypothetical protein
MKISNLGKANRARDNGSSPSDKLMRDELVGIRFIPANMCRQITREGLGQIDWAGKVGRSHHNC